MFRKETYVRRRNELRKRIEGGLVLLPGNGESPANYPSNQFRFRQDSTFLYFFGLNRPDYVGLMDIDSGEETLYGDDYTIDDIIWMGPQPTLDEQAREVGIGKTLPLSQLGKRIEAAVAKGRKVHFLPPYRGETTLQIARLLGLAPERVPLYASVELAKAVVALREIKDTDEIDQIEKACEIGSKMHRMAMKMCRPGVVEREIAEGLKSLGLMRGDMQDAVTVGAQALFMPHGLGHQMGLDVHDMENIGEKYVGYDEQTLRSSTPGLSSLRMGKRLREGMVITVEPGIYFIPALIEKWEREGLGGGFIDFAKVREYLDFGGIRIEDDMLITSFGNRLLGGNRPPVTTAQIEEYMND